MNPALQSAFVQTDLVQHRPHRRYVTWLAGVRGAQHRELSGRDSESFDPAHQDRGHRLKRLRAGSKEGTLLQIADPGHH
jgi:hypothetical protein